MKFSRSVSVDVFFSKQRQRQYNRHLRKIEQIKSHHDNHQKQVQQVKRLSKKLKKARSQARDFKSKEDKYHRYCQDTKMIKNIQQTSGFVKFKTQMPSEKKTSRKVINCQLQNKQYMKDRRPNPHTQRSNQQKQHYLTHLYTAGSTVDSQHRKPISVRQYLQQSQNKKLVEGIKSYQVNAKSYKKKLAGEIDQYLKLREHIQRFKKLNRDGSPFSRKTKTGNKTERSQCSSNTQHTKNTKMKKDQENAEKQLLSQKRLTKNSGKSLNKRNLKIQIREQRNQERKKIEHIINKEEQDYDAQQFQNYSQTQDYNTMSRNKQAQQFLNKGNTVIHLK